MALGAGRSGTSTIALGVLLALGVPLALSCGRTSWDERFPPDASNASAGSATSGAAGGDGGGAAAGGAHGLAGAPGGAGSGTAGSGSGIVVFEGSVNRIGVVGDREGNALLQWDSDGGQVRFARWSAAEKLWRYPAPLVLDLAFVVDTYGSGHPILIGDEVDPQSKARTTVIRRFDVRSNEWGPAQPTPIEGSFAYGFYVSMDGAGNVYTRWRADDQTSVDWSWLPADASVWAPLRNLERASAIVGARRAGAWLWQENYGFGVRAFDLRAGDWSDEHELASFQSGTGLDIHYLAVGPSGEALAAALHHAPTELVMSTWRYDPTRATWQPQETALQIPTNEDPRTTYGAPLPVTDFLHQDVVAVPRRVGNQSELHMNRWDPTTRAWSPLRDFVGVMSSSELEMTADDSGNLYGCVPPFGVFQYNSASGAWSDPGPDAECEFAVSRTGAFALGRVAGNELTAYRHPGGDNPWRSARGMPSGAFPELGSVPYAIAPLDEGRAIVIWQLRHNPNTRSVRAAFIE